MIVAQLPGAEQAINSAAREGWVAVLLVVIVLATFTTFGIVIHRIMKESTVREDRLSSRVAHLEDVIRTELLLALKSNSESMGRMLTACESICRAADQMTNTLERFTSILDVRPCLLPVAEQRRIMKDLEGLNDK
jgi:hypothetical protein